MKESKAMGMTEEQKKERSKYLNKNLVITDCSQMKPYIFVSYASDNWETVFKEAAVPLQNQYGLRIYADKAFDNVNDRWIVPMLRNVRGADVMVAFVSQSYIESYACFLELLTAVNNKKHIVFVSLEEELHLGKTTELPPIERGVKNELINQGFSLSANTNNSSNDIMRAMRSAFTSISTLLEQDALSKYDISGAFISFFRDASVNKKTLNDLTALKYTVESLSSRVFDIPSVPQMVQHEENSANTAEAHYTMPKTVPGAAAAADAPPAAEKKKFSKKLKLILAAAGGAVLIAAAVLIIVLNTPYNVTNELYETPSGYEGTYTGQWLNSQPNGKGIFIRNNGAVYDCEWKGGLPNGYGSVTLPDGSAYVGEWKDGKYDGQGVITNPDGSFYKGEFEGGEITGKGSYTDSDGKVTSGIWKDGVFVGEG